MALKNIFLQLSEAKVFDRLTRFSPVYQGSDLDFISAADDEKKLMRLLDKLHDRLCEDEKPDPENFKYLCRLTKTIKEGKFNNELLVDPSPDFKTRKRPKFKGIVSVVKKLDKFIPVYKERFQEQLEILQGKSEELEQRGFHYASEELGGYCKALSKRFDWFWTLYSYEESPYMRMFGLLDCIEDCSKIFEDAKDSRLKEHRGWLNILCNVFAFFVASATVIPMIIYCCYYASHKRKDNNFSFTFRLKTESLKLLEQAEDVIRIEELRAG